MQFYFCLFYLREEDIDGQSRKLVFNSCEVPGGEEMSNKVLWQDWDEEDWANAAYCPDCGLPMILVDGDGKRELGKMQCVYCTWEQDQTIIFDQKLAQLRAELAQLKDKADQQHELAMAVMQFQGANNRIAEQNAQFRAELDEALRVISDIWIGHNSDNVEAFLDRLSAHPEEK